MAAEKFYVGAGSFQKRGDVYRIDARKVGIPKEWQRQSFRTKREAEARLRWLEDWRKKNNTPAFQYFTRDELEAARITLVRWQGHSESRPSLDELVSLGLVAYEKKGHKTLKVTFEEAAKRWVDFREQPEGKKRGNGKVEASQLSEEKELLRRFCKKFGFFQLGYFFSEPDPSSEPDEKPKIRLQRFISDLKRKDGKAYSEISKNSFSKVITKFFAWMKEEYEIAEPDPSVGLPAKFRIPVRQNAPVLSAKEISRLFEALKEPEYNELLPYCSLLFFSGRRPLELSHPNNKERRFRFENFGGWKNKSKISEGLTFTVPAHTVIGGKKVRLAKGDTDSRGDLTKSGVQWMRFYFETIKEVNLPDYGPIFYSRRRWEKLRKDVGVFESWENDVARHTFATAVHTVYPESSDYWLRMLGHSEKVYRNHYQHAAMSTEDAEEIVFGIRPPIASQA